jgi:hypothetical protein
VDALADVRPRLMQILKPFDGYIEKPVRVSPMSLVHVDRNRYSVPTEYAHRIATLRSYPTYMSFVADSVEIARHPRSFDRHRTFYDWRYYITLVERKLGSLRSGAPFLTMPGRCFVCIDTC